MYDVFISYRRDTGKDLASSFVHLIENNGFYPYFDINDYSTGEFRENIKQAIKNSKLFLLLITEGSIERFQNPKDISRLEVEYAFENGLSIMPISAIGERVFDEIKMYKSNLPESIVQLTNHNVEFYKHELQKSTHLAILKNLEVVQKDYFSKMQPPLENIVGEISPFDFVEYVENYSLKIDSEDCLYTGLLKHGKPSEKCLIRDIESDTIYEMTYELVNPYFGFGKHVRNGALLYRGEFHNLNYSGKGELFEKDGIYVGGFLNGCKNGKGIKTFKDGKVFNGYWVGNDFKGPFIKFTDFKTTYSGQVQENKPHGYGEMIKEDIFYNGLFRNGEFYEGIIKFKDKIVKGDFSYPTYKKMLFDQENRLVYEGQLKDFKIAGQGKLYVKGLDFGKFNIPTNFLNQFKTHIPNFDTLDLILHADFINETQININNEIKVTHKNNGMKIISGYLKEHKELFINADGESIEINISYYEENRVKRPMISTDFRVRD